ncbi:uncharacterized protein L969DRAFT_43016 [Mixia osmundae IAM 14324]|uniref:Zinc finger Mcm10/DnaG-type domain-containing protein n=1 Tax=Mixia osmundae (strain CBS 9802 / IAM 14324 / JCM 22182 / KY 12970) TaxID=764103 RepID=G7E862_MIXOS|nr:uncharacterized protein L969DRAFT_43016 [Mixia osmundae IAM 14324]KEI42386.1 hypothetical protein L969DRAFT_43016 [Mixia osmundae IAM 14324]GAA99022.1 hypothetical protein E5Q_05711 [Mixia osmundae IAM 14324]
MAVEESDEELLVVASPKKQKAAPQHALVYASTARRAPGAHHTDVALPRIAQSRSSELARALAAERKPRDLTDRRDKPASSFLAASTKVHTLLKHQEFRRNASRATSFGEPAARRHRRIFQADEQPHASTSRATQADRLPSQPCSPDPARQRGDDLTLVEDLEPCPLPHRQRPDDPDYQQIEPYSGIRLRDRILAHAELEEHLEDRFYLSPRRIYSMVREVPGRAGHLDLPIERDWIVIGILCEKSPIRMTSQIGDINQPAQDEPADEELDEVLGSAAGKGRRGNALQAKQRTKKSRRYISFKFVDLGSLNAGGGEGVMNVQLFEAEHELEHRSGHSSDEEQITAKRYRIRKETYSRDGQGRKGQIQKRHYTGGSGGAYEAFWKAQNGTVVAILNPNLRRQRPLPGRPDTKMIMLSPENATSVLLIGHARDLGECEATRRDGQPCTAWCDRRAHPVCDFHLESNLAKQRARRPEFSTGNSGMSTGLTRGKAARKGAVKGGGKLGFGPAREDDKPDYANKTGLLPRNNKTVIEGVTTFVMASSLTEMPKRRRFGESTYSEPLDPSSKEAKKRRHDQSEKEIRLKEGFAEMLKNDRGSIGAQYLREVQANKTARSEGAAPTTAAQEDQAQLAMQRELKQRVYDPTKLRMMGFDPVADKHTTRSFVDPESQQAQSKAMAALEAKRAKSRINPKLNAPPTRVSNVRAPLSPVTPAELLVELEISRPLSDSCAAKPQWRSRSRHVSQALQHVQHL